MRSHRVSPDNQKWILAVAILLVAFGLRASGPGAAPLQGDEVWSGYLAFQFGALGERAPLGVVSSTGLHQAPLLSDVFALPFFINPDPRIARLFMALLQVLGMAALFQVGRRVWSFNAGLAALAIMATMPRAVWAGRFLWNPYLAVPLVAAYLLTGFALSDDRLWGKLGHPLGLALVIQAHPSGMAFVPLSILFYARWFFRREPQNLKRSLIQHLIGFGLAGLSALPWVLGTFGSTARENLSVADLSWASASSLSHILEYLQRVTTQLDVGAFGIPAEDYLAPAGYGAIALVLNYGVMFGAAFLALRGLVRSQFRDVAAGLCFWAFPLTLSVLPSNTYDFYLALLLPCAALVWGALLMGADKQSRKIMAAKWVLVASVVLAQLYVSVNGIQQLFNFNHYTRESTLPLDDMVALRDAATSENRETLFVVEGASPDDFEQALLWQILAGHEQYRVIWGDTRTIPIPPEGAVYVDYDGASTLPDTFGNHAEYQPEQGLYRVVTLPAGSTFTPACEAVEPSRFAIGRGARILGYIVPDEAAPVPGSEWRIFLLWEGQQHEDGTNYQMAVHLINDAGDKFAQVDVPTLPPFMWRAGEQLVTPIEFSMPDTLPVTSTLSLRIIFYTLSDMASANAVDADGNVVAPWVIMPLCTENP